MRFYYQNGLLLSLFLFTTCINPNSSNNSAIASLVYTSNLKPTVYSSNQLSGCILTTSTSSGRFSLCFNVSPTNCTVGFFTNITTSSILQKRIDDLTFININYPNCSTSAGSLFTKYNALATPTGMIFKDYLGINGNIDKNNFTITNKSSCESIGLQTQSFVLSNFTRLLTEEEIQKLNSIEVELALIPSTTNACITDLNFQASFLPTITSLRDGNYARGIVCSHQASTGFTKCPWLN